jgi:hypothetical protein
MRMKRRYNVRVAGGGKAPKTTATLVFTDMTRISDFSRITPEATNASAKVVELLI